MSSHEDGYSGPARLAIGHEVFDVQVELRGHFEPIDGRYHWYGRIAKSEALAAVLRDLKTAGIIHTPHGNRQCEVAEPDTWDRYRITGYSTPPFPLPLAVQSGDASDLPATRTNPPGRPQ